MSPRLPSWKALRAIAAADVTDRIRSGVGASVLVQPAILLLVLLMGVVAPRLSSVKPGEGLRSVAVAEGASSETAAARLVRELVRREPRFVVREVRDVEDEVAAENADTGLVEVLGPAGEELRVVVLPSRRRSKVAAAELTDSLRRVQIEQLGVPGPEIRTASLQDSAEAGRIGLASLLPFLVAFQLVSLFAEASIRLRGSKTDRSAEVYHVLPVQRIDLVLGRAAVGLADGAVRLGAMLLIAAALPFVPTTLATFSVPGRTLAALAVAGACQVVLATAGGTLLGATVRSEGQETAVATAVSLALSGVFLGLTFSASGPLPGFLAAIPYIGAISWARNAFFGEESLAAGAAAIAVSLGFATAMVALAAGALGRDGVTLRES